MLKEMTLYGEVDKVKVAINRLKLHEPPEGYYVAYREKKEARDKAYRLVERVLRNQRDKHGTAQDADSTETREG